MDGTCRLNLPILTTFSLSRLHSILQRSMNRAGSINGTARAMKIMTGFGKEVMAPADGVVLEVIDGIRDNVPGIANPYALIGNAIVLQHGQNEYSVLAYLKQNSIRVRVGDRILKGQAIAQCGNSGGSLQPGIHIHLQDSPIVSVASGVKFYFEKAGIIKDGNKEIKSNYLPADRRSGRF